MACILLSAIGRMANSLSDVLIAVGIVVVVALVMLLNEKGKIRISDRFLGVMKKIGTGIVVVLPVAYFCGLAGYALYSVVKLNDWYGVILLTVCGAVVGVLWYVARWRRWWIKFLKTFQPKDVVHHSDWKLREEHFWTFDYGTMAQYGLRPVDGIFYGQARVWLDKRNVDVSAKLKLSIFEEQLRKRGIDANCALVHIPGCIYADIVAEMRYKSMDRIKQAAFRDTFHELDRINYQGEYYVEYHGELGTFLFAACQDNISRAIRTEPREEYFLEPECGFQSEEAHYFVERYPAWDEGTYTFISEKAFFERWRKRTDYEANYDAFAFFESASELYFAAIANEDKKEQANSCWDIEHAAKWLIANNETDTMVELMSIGFEPMYWAARLFREFEPEEAQDAIACIIGYCENPEIVSRARKLQAQSL